jgi:3'-phosphoadenosine 5'-phosphosulfate sulfotransferase (PAPS reductase)/FAD synthetase
MTDTHSNADLWHMVSVSGGKDSTATALLARERGVRFHMVFADTEHEHPDTYAYLDYLEDWFKQPIRRVRADFSRQLQRKAEYIREHWLADLTKGEPGGWIWFGDEDDEPDQKPPAPREQGRALYFSHRDCDVQIGYWRWSPPRLPLSSDEAEARVEAACAMLKPTGNLFLDLCLWKGRFPSTRRWFCSQKLKHEPIRDQVVEPMQADGYTVVSWQGVRAAESAGRALLDVVEAKERQLIVYRPIITWSAADVFAMHRKHGAKWNPLYEQAMKRVGCWPCIHSGKEELREIARRWPERIEWLAEMEAAVSTASKRGMSTFYDVRALGLPLDVIHHQTHGIRAAVSWANTSRGGRNFAFDFAPPTGECSSIYGLCESAG